MDELDSKKFHVITKPQKKWAIIVGLIIVLLALPPVAYKYYQFAINRTSQGFKEAQFEISEGEAVSTIAQRLYTQDLVNSEFLFKAYLISRGLHTKIQAGIYQIPAGSSVIELSEIFQHGTNDVTITFLEGWRVEEYARIAEERLHKIDYGEVVRLSKKYEGFLFPDTYFFNKDVKETLTFFKNGLMKNQFDEKKVKF